MAISSKKKSVTVSSGAKEKRHHYKKDKFSKQKPLIFLREKKLFVFGEGEGRVIKSIAMTFIGESDADALF